jgi:hypothetical protein
MTKDEIRENTITDTDTVAKLFTCDGLMAIISIGITRGVPPFTRVRRSRAASRGSGRRPAGRVCSDTWSAAGPPSRSGRGRPGRRPLGRAGLRVILLAGDGHGRLRLAVGVARDDAREDVESDLIW